MTRLFVALATVLAFADAAHASRADHRDALGHRVPLPSCRGTARNGQVTLIPFGTETADREPLVFVYGYAGSPEHFAALASRLRGDYQIYFACYDSVHRRTSESGVALAEALRALSQKMGDDRDITIVAHSMGGLVVREALNELTLGRARGIERFDDVHVIAVDTPWHGYDGPADRGAGRTLMNLARPVLPDGLEDMRAESLMFLGDPKSADPAQRRGLLDVELPDNVSIDLVFAEQPNVTTHYDEGALRSLSTLLANHFANDAPMRGNPQLINFWKGLLASSEYDAFANELRALADDNRLDAAAAHAALLRHFPVFAGDHLSVLAEQPGHPSLVNHLWLALAKQSAPFVALR